MKAGDRACEARESRLRRSRREGLPGAHPKQCLAICPNALPPNITLSLSPETLRTADTTKHNCRQTEKLSFVHFFHNDTCLHRLDVGWRPFTRRARSANPIRAHASKQLEVGNQCGSIIPSVSGSPLGGRVNMATSPLRDAQIVALHEGRPLGKRGGGLGGKRGETSPGEPRTRTFPLELAGPHHLRAQTTLRGQGAGMGGRTQVTKRSPHALFSRGPLIHSLLLSRGILSVLAKPCCPKPTQPKLEQPISQNLWTRIHQKLIFWEPTKRQGHIKVGQNAPFGHGGSDL